MRVSLKIKAWRNLGLFLLLASCTPEETPEEIIDDTNELLVQVKDMRRDVQLRIERSRELRKSAIELGMRVDTLASHFNQTQPGLIYRKKILP